MQLTLLFGIIALVLTVVGYFYYFRDIFRGKTKPHAFTWFVWAVLTAIAFAAQVVEGGGPGAWVTGLTALVCFVIAGVALKVGVKKFPLSDWLALAACGVALLLWWLTDSPLLSVILITITDAVAFLPTFKKSYYRPEEETQIEYVLASVKFVFGIFALNTLSLSTWLYPISLVIMNSVFVVFTLIRKKQIAKK